MQYSYRSYSSLPHVPGVYQFLNANGEILYVGKAKDLKNRVSQYFANPTLLIGKTKVLISQITTIRIIPVASELESLLLEAALIKKYMPKYNIRLTDGKAYPLIRITIKSDYPAVVTARRIEDKKSVYFGPYPSATSMRYVLKILRRIFPFQSVLNHPKKICLYHHLGLCPCPPTFTTPEQKKEYKQTLRHISTFLNGDVKDVVGDLEKEREAYSKEENFEKAAFIQRQLDAIARVTEPFHNPFEYVANPNFLSDVREEEMKSLQEILVKHGVAVGMPRRIECYDNSNFQGTNPTSSMVVLTNGEVDKSQYRKFKIRTVKGPNDFDSMKEVLARRFKHAEWPFPDLLVVDGGKGQVGAANKALSSISSLSSLGEGQGEVGSRQSRTIKSIPLIGLAKREEIIITSDFQEIRLPKSSKALQLIMKIRDEAHRFAITFHRKLRGKGMFTA